MRVQAEVIAIGNEVLSGFVINSNAALIGQKLLSIGIDVRYHQTVADDADAIGRALELAFSRCHVVICTGGLGPTLDDHTRAAAAHFFESSFHFDQSVANELHRRYGDRLISLQDQATVPSKAQVLLNYVGTAPGLIFEKSGRIAVLLPGVPVELEALFAQLLPELNKRFGQNAEKRKIFHLYGLSESAIDPTLRRLQEKLPEIHFGIYPRQGTLSVHMYAEEQHSFLLQKAAETFQAEYHAQIFSSDPFATLASALQELFIAKGWTLACAESCTGGMIAADLCSQAGASQYFLGGITAYSNAMKELLLGVSPATLQRYGAVSVETAKAMAAGALQVSGAAFAVATTGIAGPGGGSQEKPVGTVCIAVASRHGEGKAVKLSMTGNRSAIMRKGAALALAELWKYTHGVNSVVKK